MKGLNRSRARGKLTPRYIDPFRILEHCGPVAYRLELLEQLPDVHNVFHVSQLKNCLQVPEQIIEIEGVELEPDLTYAKYHVIILDQKDRVTQNRTIKFYKVHWNKHSEEEATWESEDYLRENYPDFLASI
jgi:hypothetical protein